MLPDVFARTTFLHVVLMIKVTLVSVFTIFETIDRHVYMYFQRKRLICDLYCILNSFSLSLRLTHDANSSNANAWNHDSNSTSSHSLHLLMTATLSILLNQVRPHVLKTELVGMLTLLFNSDHFTYSFMTWKHLYPGQHFWHLFHGTKRWAHLSSIQQSSCGHHHNWKL